MDLGNQTRRISSACREVANWFDAAEIREVVFRDGSMTTPDIHIALDDGTHSPLIKRASVFKDAMKDDSFSILELRKLNPARRDPL